MRISDWSSDVCSSDLLVLRRRYGDREQALHLPGGPLIPIAATLLSIGLLASASIENLLAGAVALLLGAVIYRFRRKPGAAAPSAHAGRSDQNATTSGRYSWRLPWFPPSPTGGLLASL